MRALILPTLLIAAVSTAPALACESEAQALFICTTDLEDKGFIEFCSDADAILDPIGAAQLFLGNADGTVTGLPANGPAAPDRFAFSHSNGTDGYLVTVRFSDGADTYHLYSLAVPPSGEEGDMGGGEAGIGRLMSDGAVEPLATCAERPEIFISAMRAGFARDTASALGPAACSETGADRVTPLPASPAAPIPIAP
jgi:hypothetical protein